MGVLRLLLIIGVMGVAAVLAVMLTISVLVTGAGILAAVLSL